MTPEITSHDIEHRLQDMGIVLPDAPAPAANYVPWLGVGDLVFISGQVAVQDGIFITGRLGASLDIPTGQAAARVCAINLLAQLKSALNGDWTRLIQAVRLGGFVNATSDFTEHPQVINGASDFLVSVLGSAGQHTRAAVGVSSLPFGVAVEIDGVFRVRAKAQRNTDGPADETFDETLAKH